MTGSGSDKLSAPTIVRLLVRAKVFEPRRLAVLLRQGLVMRRHGTSPLSGLSLSAVAVPDRAAVVDERGTVTYGELNRRVDALAVGLVGLGVGRGDSVGILCRNHRGLVEAVAACSRIGADALLLNTGFAGPALTEVLSREKARLVIHDEEFEDLVRTSGREVPTVLGWTADATRGTTIESLIADNLGRRPPRAASPGRVVLLTSGTSGTPKGAPRSAERGVASLVALFDRIPWRGRETVVIAAPAFHAFGFGQVAIAMTLGCTVVLSRRFDPAATLALVDQHRATGLAAVPVMLERIVDLDGPDAPGPSSLRFVTMSGSRMRADAVTAFMDRFGDVLYNSYNATEVGLVSTATPADLRAAPDTAGRPLAGTRVRLLDARGFDVPPGSVGRIAVASGSVFSGYTDGKNKESIGEFTLSGDTGRFDADGRLYVLGREDDMIVSGGENVFPAEVERVLQEHPGVREVAVVGVDDHSFGQRLAAFVVLVPGASVEEQELKEHVRAHLAGFKVPRDVHFLEGLPRNASGKVLTRELRGSGS
jgi:acyl-CoA synthetase (AMP-forming)/AMP-acid ligase II